MINSARKYEECGYYFSIREDPQRHIHHNHLQSLVKFLPFPQVQITGCRTSIGHHPQHNTDIFDILEIFNKRVYIVVLLKKTT